VRGKLAVELGEQYDAVRHVAAFFSPFGILRARTVFSYIRRRLDQDRLTEKFLIC
jgi:hypothetical protein